MAKWLAGRATISRSDITKMEESYMNFKRLKESKSIKVFGVKAKRLNESFSKLIKENAYDTVTRFKIEYYTDPDLEREVDYVYADTKEEARREIINKTKSNGIKHIVITGMIPEEVPASYKDNDLKESTNHEYDEEFYSICDKLASSAIECGGDADDFKGNVAGNGFSIVFTSAVDKKDVKSFVKNIEKSIEKSLSETRFSEWVTTRIYRLTDEQVKQTVPQELADKILSNIVVYEIQVDGRCMEDLDEAFDIEADQYFTKEDLIEFAEDVVDSLNGISYSKFDYTEVYIEPGNILELTLVWSDYEETFKERIDMRKIKKPFDLIRIYSPIFIKKAKEVFSEYGADFGPHLSDQDYPMESLSESSSDDDKYHAADLFRIVNKELRRYLVSEPDIEDYYDHNGRHRYYLVLSFAKDESVEEQYYDLADKLVKSISDDELEYKFYDNHLSIDVTDIIYPLNESIIEAVQKEPASEKDLRSIKLYRKDLKLLLSCETIEDIDSADWNYWKFDRKVHAYMNEGSSFEDAIDQTSDDIQSYIEYAKNEYKRHMNIETHAKELFNKVKSSLSKKYDLSSADEKNAKLVFNPPVDANHKDCIEFVDDVVAESGGRYSGTGRGGSWTKWNILADDVEFKAGWGNDDSWVIEFPVFISQSNSESIMESSSDWRFVDSKQVPDSNGFMDDYTWYENIKDGRHVFIFGDNDIYDDVDSCETDWEVDSYSEARHWFDSYNGFDEDSMYESYDRAKLNSLRQANVDAIEYFIEFEDIYPFPDGEFLANDWKELRDGTLMGMDNDLEIAEGIMEYLQKEIDFNNRHKEIYEDDPQAELTLEVYNNVKREYEREISKYESTNKTSYQGLTEDKYTRELAKRIKALTGNDKKDNKKNKNGKYIAKWKVVQTSGAKMTIADDFTSEQEAAQYVRDHGGVSKLKVIKYSVNESLISENYKLDDNYIIIDAENLIGKSKDEIKKILDEAPIGSQIIHIRDKSNRFNIDKYIEKAAAYKSNYHQGIGSPHNFKNHEVFWKVAGYEDPYIVTTIYNAVNNTDKYLGLTSNVLKAHNLEEVFNNELIESSEMETENQEEHIYLTLNDIILTVNENTWDYNTLDWTRNEEETNGDWYSVENRIKIGDPDDIETNFDSIFEKYLPDTPGTYKFSCDAELVYDLSNIYASYDYFQTEDGFDYDKEVYTDDVDIKFNPEKSKISNFKIEPLNK